MDLFSSFLTLSNASSPTEFSAIPLAGARGDFIAKSCDSAPVFLLHDAGPASYSPNIELKHISAQFHATCRVVSPRGTVDDQFAILSCDSNAPELHELFVRSVAAAVEQLPVRASTAEVQRCVHALLDLFSALTRPSSRAVTGLWAELFVMLQATEISRALECWHADQFERYDFSWPLGRLEVKAATKDLRQHEFSLEQLQAPDGEAGYVASMLLQPLNGGIGVIDLASLIERAVATRPELRQKLWRNIAAALGSDFYDRLDRKFDLPYADRNLAVYRMSDVPSPLPPTDARITSIRFRVDLTSVRSSLTDSPRGVIAELFR